MSEFWKGLLDEERKDKNEYYEKTLVLHQVRGILKKNADVNESNVEVSTFSAQLLKDVNEQIGKIEEKYRG